MHTFNFEKHEYKACLNDGSIIPSPQHGVGTKAAETTLLLNCGGYGHGSKEGLNENTTENESLKDSKKIIKSHHQERIQWTAGMLLLCKITIKLRLMSFPTNYPQSVGRDTLRFHFTHSNSFPYLQIQGSSHFLKSHLHKGTHLISVKGVPLLAVDVRSC